MPGRTPWLLLLPVVLSASWRASRCFATLPLDRALKQLADAPLLPVPLRDPVTLRELVDRILPWLPPRGLRSCLKRSLLLVDLWSRCGLTPRFHLGYIDGGGSRDGHAWVTVSGSWTLSSDPGPSAGVVLWETVPAGK